MFARLLWSWREHSTKRHIHFHSLTLEYKTRSPQTESRACLYLIKVNERLLSCAACRLVVIGSTIRQREHRGLGAVFLLLASSAHQQIVSTQRPTCRHSSHDSVTLITAIKRPCRSECCTASPWWLSFFSSHSSSPWPQQLLHKEGKRKLTWRTHKHKQECVCAECQLSRWRISERETIACSKSVSS